MTWRWRWGAERAAAESAPPPRRKRLHLWAALLVLLLTACAVWVTFVQARIRWFATHDQAQPADAIAVFGAAEYDGRPSPVLRARLMHALALYREKLAPLVITLGGNEAGEPHSEGGVGKDFLLAHGVPEASIIAETRSRDTRESAAQLAAIAHGNALHSIIVVSDGTHLFRVHALCEAEGLVCYTSPREENVTLTPGEQLHRLFHEVVSYTAWRLHLLR